MFHKIKAISTKESYILVALFECGEKKQFDVKPLFSKISAFQALQSIEGLFNQVRVDAGGYGISWNDELDLSCNDLWEHGTPFTDNKIA